MNKFLRFLTLTLTAVIMPQINADSGKGKIRTAVKYDGTVVHFKARPNISNTDFYKLVSKKTGAPLDYLEITGLRYSSKQNLSAKKLARFHQHPPRAFKRRHIVRTITAPVAPIAEVTVIPVVDAADDLVVDVFGGHKD